MKEQDEDKGYEDVLARRRFISKTKMKEQYEHEGAWRKWRSKTEMKEQYEDSSLVSFTQGVAICVKVVLELQIL